MSPGPLSQLLDEHTFLHKHWNVSMGDEAIISGCSLHVNIWIVFGNHELTVHVWLTVRISFSFAFSLMAISLLLVATVTNRWLQALRATLPCMWKKKMDSLSFPSSPTLPNTHIHLQTLVPMSLLVRWPPLFQSAPLPCWHSCSDHTQSWTHTCSRLHSQQLGFLQGLDHFLKNKKKTIKIGWCMYTPILDQSPPPPNSEKILIKTFQG